MQYIVCVFFSIRMRSTCAVRSVCVCSSLRTRSTCAVHSVCVFQSENRICLSQGKMFGCEPYCKDFVWFHHKVGEENFYRQYDVKVQALNNMGAGPNTTVEIVMSAEDSEW